MKLLTLLPFLAAACLAFPLALRTPLATRGVVDHSLSLPGIQFRRVATRASAATEPKIQNYLKLSRQPRPDGTQRHVSVTSRLGGIQRDNGAKGYENITVTNSYATEHAVEATFNGITLKLLLDTGSADTWVKSGVFVCKTASNESQPGSVCALGPAYGGEFTGAPIDNQHFSIKYADGEAIRGRLGYMDVEFANITVHGQEVAMADEGTWHGDNVTSGVLGLAYPSLTNAYWGSDLDDNSQPQPSPYSPIFSSMVFDGLVEAYFVVALDRNTSNGMIGIGDYPPIDISKSWYSETPLLIADLVDKDITASQPSFYTIIPDGFRYGQTDSTDRYPYIIDTGTTLTYVPPALADAINGQFVPPATYMSQYGSYFTACDAIPPKVALLVESSQYIFNPLDLINTEAKDPETGLCQTGIASGGVGGPFVLGENFLTNVVVQFNVEAGLVRINSREFY
ncbi:acid protease [Xylariomycetidae sp. FL0641]|nr:acid protease [Xylariomycetidae sp. FL0641]